MKKPKSRVKVILYWASLLFFLLLISFAIKAFFVYKKSTLPSQGRLTFVLVTTKPQVLVFSLQESEGIILKLDPKTKLELAYGFGEYELSKVYPLGELEKKGSQLLRESLQGYLAAPIFGYFYVDDSFDYLSLSAKKLFTQVFWQALRGRAKTDFGKVDLILLLVRARRLNELLIKTKEYPEAEDNYFQDRKLRTESFSVEVLNATDHAGLAQKVFHLLENSGLRVVRIADSPERREKSFLEFKEMLRGSYSFKWLSKVFGFEGKVVPDKERADFSLVVGEDYWEKLSKRW